ncbi:hypothetical protein D1007_32661 [Hordeum vulgare]|nr:hypothetical protein D1007_32661 [Hordeum vulgare]
MAPPTAPKDQVPAIKSEELMKKIVNIHYDDKEAFMNVDIVDKYEEVLTFFDSPTYEEVVVETRIRLKWVDPSDQVELLGRYDVGSAQKCRMKTMSIKSNLHWVAYKEVVASSIDNSLEVFASMVVNAPLFHVDLNQPLVDDLSPYSGVPPIVEHKVEVEANEYPQYEFGGSASIKDDGHDSDEEYERQHNIIGDVEAQVRHDDMDPNIVYQCACVDESDDEVPMNELDEDGFTEKEADWYTKITGRDHKVPLFCDVSLADKALVDGGMSKTIEARMFPSSTHNAISTSYLKKGLMFDHILELKMWLCEYAVKHYRPFKVVHSDCHKRYTMKCEIEKSKWKVNGRLRKDEVVQVLAVKAVQVVAFLWAEYPAVVDVVVQLVSFLWAEYPAVVDVVVQVVSFLWAEDPVVVDVVVRALVVVLVVEEVLWVEVPVVVEECSDTYKDHFRMAASQPNKATTEWGDEKDAASEEQRLMERAATKLRDEDAAEVRKKKEEEYNARMKDELKIYLEHARYEKKMKEQDKKTMEKRKKEFEANFKKMVAEGAAKREREHERFTERVMEEATKMCKREEEEEEEEGKGALLDTIEPEASILMCAFIFEPYVLLNLVRLRAFSL